MIRGAFGLGRASSPHAVAEIGGTDLPSASARFASLLDPAGAPLLASVGRRENQASEPQPDGDRETVAPARTPAPTDERQVRSEKPCSGANTARETVPTLALDLAPVLAFTSALPPRAVTARSTTSDDGSAGGEHHRPGRGAKAVKGQGSNAAAAIVPVHVALQAQSLPVRESIAGAGGGEQATEGQLAATLVPKAGVSRATVAPEFRSIAAPTAEKPAAVDAVAVIPPPTPPTLPASGFGAIADLFKPAAPSGDPRPMRVAVDQAGAAHPESLLRQASFTTAGEPSRSAPQPANTMIRSLAGTLRMATAASSTAASSTAAWRAAREMPNPVGVAVLSTVSARSMRDQAAETSKPSEPDTAIDQRPAPDQVAGAPRDMMRAATGMRASASVAPAYRPVAQLPASGVAYLAHPAPLRAVDTAASNDVKPESSSGPAAPLALEPSSESIVPHSAASATRDDPLEKPASRAATGAFEVMPTPGPRETVSSTYATTSSHADAVAGQDRLPAAALGQTGSPTPGPRATVSSTYATTSSHADAVAGPARLPAAALGQTGSPAHSPAAQTPLPPSIALAPGLGARGGRLPSEQAMPRTGSQQGGAPEALVAHADTFLTARPIANAQSGSPTEKAVVATAPEQTFGEAHTPPPPVVLAPVASTGRSAGTGPNTRAATAGPDAMAASSPPSEDAASGEQSTPKIQIGRADPARLAAPPARAQIMSAARHDATTTRPDQFAPVSTDPGPVASMPVAGSAIVAAAQRSAASAGPWSHLPVSVESLAPAAASMSPASDPVTRHLDLASGDAWLDRLSADIAASSAADAPLRFALSPERLGRMSVELATVAEGTALKLTVETHEAHRIVADAQPQLVAEARAQGLRITEAQVDLGGGGSRQGQGQPRSASAGDGQAGQRRPAPEPTRASAVPTVARPTVRSDAPGTTRSDLYA